jgi:signal transduction histidine kinase
VIHSVPQELIDAVAGNAAHRDLIVEMSPHSMIAVPLLSGERVLGTMLFASSRPSLRYEPRHAQFAERFGRRAALAIANAHLHQVAQDAADARADVLAIVAHDLRGPLSTIGMSSELLRGRLAPGAEDRTVRTILRSTERMNRLIQDLLDASRTTTDRLSLMTASMPATLVVDDALEIARTLAADRPITVERSDELPIVRADRERVVQVITNLIGNAVKFSPAGSAIAIGGHVDGEMVRFWVRDHGPGLTAEQLAHVFERFWKGHRDDRRGVGLGLFISKQIVEDHGGYIGVESIPGQGATFHFTLPIAEPAS